MCSYLEEETEADPLIILDVFLISLILWGSVDARMGHFEADLLEVRTVDGVRRVDPTVGVENVLRNILGVDAVDGVADVLSRRHNQTEGQQDHHRDAVVQAEHGRVNVDVADFDQVLQSAEYVQHGGSRRRRSLTAIHQFQFNQSNSAITINPIGIFLRLALHPH